MKNILLADISLRESDKSSTHALSFREKIEMLRLLERLGVNAIEIPAMKNTKTDGLLLKMAADILENSMTVARVDLTESSIDETCHCIAAAKKPMLQIAVPSSIVQMEYFCHKKPPVVLEMTGQLIAHAKANCTEVEFAALDATRSERDFLISLLNQAIANGATQITLCDSAGTMMPDEFAAFIEELKQSVPQLSSVRLGVEISHKLSMADACAFSALTHGIDIIKTTITGGDFPDLANMVQVITQKSEQYQIATSIRTTELSRSVSKLLLLLQSQKSTKSPFDYGVAEERSDLSFNKNDDFAAIAQACIKLGYELSEEDQIRVYESFAGIAAKKEAVGSRELEAIIASTALQVPQTYKIENFVITSGNRITSTATVSLLKNGVLMQGVSLGDGSIDAAFLAIEQIIGHHFELDDFQLQSVTEGREAMGSALVKLRHAGKLYAGNGISTDIVEASIIAYVNALNKIAYEEENR